MIQNRSVVTIRPSNEAENVKITYLDGLRGVAALVVVFSHLIYMLLPAMQTGNFATAHYVVIEKIIRYSPLSLFYNGSFAVYIFFVLSGYVLTYKFFKTRNSEIIVSGAIRRYIRLMIPVLFVVLLAFTCMYLGLFQNREAAGLTNSDTWLKTFYDFKPDLVGAIYQGLYGTFVNGDISYDQVLWTMKYEFFGSMLVYVMALFFGNLRHRWIFYGATALLLADTCYLSFVIGLVFSDLYNSFDRRRFAVESKYILIFLLICGLSLGSIYEAGILMLLARFGIWLPATLLPISGAGMILFVLLNSRFLQGLLATKIPAYLGKISFSMYLIHLIVICSLSSALIVLLGTSVTYYLVVLIVAGISIPVILVTSDLVYRFIDTNGVRLSKRMYDLLFSARLESGDERPVDERKTNS